MNRTAIGLLFCVLAAVGQTLQHPSKNLDIDAPLSEQVSETQRSNVRRLLKAENEAKIFHLSAEDGCKCKLEFRWTKMPDREAFVGQMFMDGEFISGTSILVWYSMNEKEPKAKHLVDKAAQTFIEDALKIEASRP